MIYYNFLLTIFGLFLCINTVFAAPSARSTLDLEIEDALSLFDRQQFDFKAENYQFSCQEFKVMAFSSQVILAGKEVQPIEDLFPEGKTHQCLVINELAPDSLGKAILSVHQIDKEPYISGYIHYKNQIYYLPSLTPITGDIITFYQPTSVDRKYIQKELKNDAVISEHPLDNKFELFGSKPERVIPKKDYPYFKKAKFRKLKIDIETDAEFLNRFKAEEEVNYDLAIQRALLYIENHYAQINLIKTRDLKIYLEVDQINLYPGEDPWLGRTRTRLLNDVTSYWNGEGWVYSDSVSEDMIIDEDRGRREDIIENGVQLFLVWVNDQREGAGNKKFRFTRDHLGLVQILFGSGSGARGNMHGLSNANRAVPYFGSYQAGYSIVGLQSGAIYVGQESQLQLDGIIESVSSGVRTLISMTHELGHNFGFDHTHNRGLDECYCEDNPHTEVNECENFRAVQEVGHIMSYCRQTNYTHDEPAKRIFSRAIFEMDEDFKADYLPVIENNNPTIRSILAPDRVNPLQRLTYAIRVQANDPDNDKLFYKFEFSNGDILYSYLPQIDYQFSPTNQQSITLTVSVFDDKFGTVSKTKEIINLSILPEEIELRIKDQQGRIIPSGIAPTGNEVILSLSFQNVGGGSVECELVFPDGSIQTVRGLNNNFDNKDNECIFLHQFNFAGRYNFISTVREIGVGEVSTQHSVRVQSLLENQAPIIQSLVQIIPNRPSRDIQSGDQLAEITTQDTLSFNIRTFDEEGDPVICSLDTGNGRPIEVLGEPINQNPTRRNCQFENIQFANPGAKRISVMVFNRMTQLTTPHMSNGRWVVNQPQPVIHLDNQQGIRSFNVNVAEIEERLRIDSVRLHDTTTDEYFVEHRPLYLYHEIYFRVRVMGESFQEAQCEYQINQGPIVIAELNQTFDDSKTCLIPYRPDSLANVNLQVRLVNYEGRPYNINMVQFDNIGRALNVGGRLRINYEVSAPQSAYPELFTTVTNRQDDGFLRPQLEGDNTSFRLIFRNPQDYSNEESIGCEINFGDGNRVDIFSERIGNNLSQCVFSHRYQNPGEYSIAYSLNRPFETPLDYSSGEETLLVLSPDLPIMGKVQRLIDREGSNRLISINQWPIYQGQNISFYVPVYRSGNQPIFCEVTGNSIHVERIEAEFEEDLYRGACIYTTRFSVSEEFDVQMYQLNFTVKTDEANPRWHEQAGVKEVHAFVFE